MTDRGTPSFPAIGTLRARRVLDVVALRLAPGLAAGILAFGHQNRPLLAAFSVLVTLAVGHVFASSAYPLHLLSLGGFASRVLPPAIGLAAAALASVLDGAGFVTAGLPSALIGSWLVLALGIWVMRRFDRSREVRLAVIGPAEIASSLQSELEASGVRGYHVCGWLDEGIEGAPAAGSDAAPRLGGLGDVRKVVTEHGIELLVNGPGTHRDRVFETVAGGCLDLPVRMIDGEELYEELLGHVPLGTINSAWFANILHPGHRPASPISKRALDLVLGTIGGLLALPILAVAAIAIKLDDGGPIFYRQRRVGEGGREFTMLKLRTMAVDAEADGVARLAAEEDDRATKVGRILRRSHLDELPQVWNVLRGEMALVGPRPERRTHVSKLEREFRYFDRRHLIKPGITGWAQVRCGYAGDGAVSWKLCHDLFYLRHRSVLADCLILVETARTVFADVQYGLRLPDERFILGEAAT